MRTRAYGRRTGLTAAAVAVALLAQGCASMGGPGAGECGRYLLGGAILGAGFGVATSGGDKEVERGATGAVVGAAAGYAVCVSVWKQKRDLEARFAALEQRVQGGSGAHLASSQGSVVRRLAVIEDHALQLDLDLMFATGTAALSERAIPHLQALAGSLRDYPDSRVLITGHTDSTGDAGRNQVLSMRRAESVQRFLAQQGVAFSRMTVEGRGSSQPTADNVTAEGRALNRRVEVTIVPFVPGQAVALAVGAGPSGG